MSAGDCHPFLAPGRRTVQGYLLVLRGHRKGRLGLLDHVIADAAEEALGREVVPRYPDCHAVWFGYNPAGEQGHRYEEPFLRYRSSRPIEGLERECNGHRVELTCTVGKAYANGFAAPITRAEGRCIDPTHSPSRSDAPS